MDLYNQLQQIHHTVLKNFTYRTDKLQYNVDEKWITPLETYDGKSKIIGDCEDFALACRKLCRDAKLATRLVICRIPEGVHCVLECEGWILDCNLHDVASRDKLTHQWIMISGYEPGSNWYKISK